MVKIKFYEIHRSDAIQVLYSKEKQPRLHTNLKLAKLLEKYFPEKERIYVVKEDDIQLIGNILTTSNF